MAFRLYTYWRSSAAYRVRIALALKGLDYESVPKHLLRDGGEQRRAGLPGAESRRAWCPALEDDGFVIPQSLAICEYLEEIHPEPRLLPGSARDRATVRGMALAIACDIASAQQPARSCSTCAASSARTRQPSPLGARTGSPAASPRSSAGRRVPGSGRAASTLCHGAPVTLADVCLVPQMYNARRFGSTLRRIRGWSRSARTWSPCRRSRPRDPRTSPTRNAVTASSDQRGDWR